MTVQNFAKSLEKIGYSVRLSTVNGFTVAMVDHDYSGPYPSRDALHAHDEISKRAYRNGFPVNRADIIPLHSFIPTNTERINRDALKKMKDFGLPNMNGA